MSKIGIFYEKQREWIWEKPKGSEHVGCRLITDLFRMAKILVDRGVKLRTMGLIVPFGG